MIQLHINKYYIWTKPEVFETWYAWTLWIRVFWREQTSTRLECSICAQTFASRSGLVQHVQHIIHDKNPRYKCESCGKGFCIRSDYFDHMAAHTGIKRNVCIVCKKRFTYTAALRAHVSRCHPKFAVKKP